MKKVFGNIPAIPFIIFIVFAAVFIFWTLSPESSEYRTLAMYTPSVCSGDIDFILNPSIALPGSHVDVSVNISLSDFRPHCGGIYALIKKGSCFNPSSVASCTFGDTQEKCIWGHCTYWHNCVTKLKAPIDLEEYTYYACVDKNKDGTFDSDEYAEATLLVGCIDFDNGNKSVKGTCADGTGTYEDECKTKVECVFEIFGKCVDYDLISYLDEYSCSNGLCSVEEIKCPCQDGRCISLDSCTPAGGKCNLICMSDKYDSSKNCPPFSGQKMKCCMPAKVITIAPENNSIVAQTSTVSFNWFPTRFLQNPNCSIMMFYPNGNITSNTIQCTNSEQCTHSFNSNQAGLNIWPGGSYEWSVQCEITGGESVMSSALFNMTVCGNGICEPPENSSNCLRDCPRNGSGNGHHRCNEDWSAGAWTPAICPSSETQTRIWIDAEECDTTKELEDLNIICILQSDGKCIEARTCNYLCSVDWKCTEWSECVGGEHYRNCYDLNNCGTDYNKPITEENCTLPFETCAELNGTICTTNQVCEGSVVKATDTDNCCVGVCTAKITLSVLLIWIVVVLGVVVVLVIIFVARPYAKHLKELKKDLKKPVKPVK